MTEIDLPPTASPTRVTWRAALAEWRWFSFAVFGSTAYGILTVLTATVLGHLVQTVATPAVKNHTFTSAMAWQIAWQLGGVVLLNVVAVIIRRIAAGITYNNLIATTRRRLTRAYQTLPLQWHQSRPAGGLLSNANSDVEQIFSVFQPLPMALGVAVMLAFGFVSIFMVDVALGLVSLVIFPLIIVLNYWFQTIMRALVEKSQAARAHVSAVADESFEGALVVKALGRRGEEVERFAHAANELRDANIRMGRTQGIFDPMTNSIPTIGTLLVVLVGAYRVKTGALQPGDVVQVAYLFSILAWPVRAFGWILFSLPQVAIGWRRVKPTIDEAAAAPPTRGSIDLPDGPLSVSLKNVSFSYTPREQDGDEEADVLHDVSLDIPAGSSLAIVGETGSGKSTLASVMVGLMPPATGTVRIDGHAPETLANRHHRVALVTQAAFVFNESAMDNVTLGRADITPERARESMEFAHADRFVDALAGGPQVPLGEAGSRLSGGQRQRIALARALADAPGLLVLDDATSAIDPAVEQRILTSLDDATSGCTTVIVAHRKSSILLADRVALLEQGRLTYIGTHEELMSTSPAYAALLTAYELDEADKDPSDADEEEQA